MEAIGAGVTAALFTVLELDRTFYFPKKAKRAALLWLWWGGFVLLNAALAYLLYGVARADTLMPSVHPVLRAMAVGASYLALIRLKLGTFEYQGQRIPFGFELAYERAKVFFYKRIDAIASDARYEESTALAAEKTLRELRDQAARKVQVMRSLTPEQKARTQRWIDAVFADAASSEDDRKFALADFCRSGQLPDD